MNVLILSGLVGDPITKKYPKKNLKKEYFKNKIGLFFKGKNNMKLRNLFK